MAVMRCAAKELRLLQRGRDVLVAEDEIMPPRITRYGVALTFLREEREWALDQIGGRIVDLRRGLVGGGWGHDPELPV